MPNTERLLVKKGTTFTNYIATTAQCCPSRASFFTGQYAHNHGVTSNRVGYPGLVDKGNVLPVWLKRAGYNTIHLGKFMNNYERFAKPESTVAPGWEQWHTVLSEAQYYDYDLFVNGRTVALRPRAEGQPDDRPEPRRGEDGQPLRAEAKTLLPAARRALAARHSPVRPARLMRARGHPRAAGRGTLQGPAAEAALVQREGHERQAVLPALSAAAERRSSATTSTGAGSAPWTRSRESIAA